MKNRLPENDFSFSGKRFSVCRKMINRSHASLFFVKLTDISERIVTRYILSCCRVHHNVPTVWRKTRRGAVYKVKGIGRLTFSPPP